MEKGTPHCKLERIKDLIAAKQIRTTQAARIGATALGMDFNAMLAVVAALTATDFYKSMTTHADHKIWQDVYRSRAMLRAGGVNLYIKLTVVDDVLIVSFKEL
jgi:motility quorum-sensing regulator / GCU-specific mRNA interferase toxin